MKKIMVIGFYSKFNIGDESYKQTFPKLFPEHDFVFEHTDKADVCILGGGDVLSENYVNIAIKADVKKRLIFSASANENTPFHLLKNFDSIVVRDKYSYNLLLQSGVNCILGADAAFYLKSNRSDGKKLLHNMFEENKLDLYSKVIGVVVNGHLGQAKDAQLARDFITLNKAAQDISALADSTSASFVFLPMSTGVPYDDRVINGFVSSRCKFWKKNHLIHDRLSVQETLNLISACDAVISTRLHSTIFSILSEIPFVDLTHHKKNESFLQTCGLENNSISYWSFSQNQLKSTLEKVMSGSMESVVSAKHSQEALLRESLKHVCFD